MPADALGLTGSTFGVEFGEGPVHVAETSFSEGAETAGRIRRGEADPNGNVFDTARRIVGGAVVGIGDALVQGVEYVVSSDPPDADFEPAPDVGEGPPIPQAAIVLGPIVLSAILGAIVARWLR